MGDERFAASFGFIPEREMLCHPTYRSPREPGGSGYGVIVYHRGRVVYRYAGLGLTADAVRELSRDFWRYTHPATSTPESP